MHSNTEDRNMGARSAWIRVKEMSSAAEEEVGVRKNDLQELHAEEQAWIFNESELSEQLRGSSTSHHSLSVIVR